MSARMVRCHTEPALLACSCCESRSFLEHCANTTTPPHPANTAGSESRYQNCCQCNPDRQNAEVGCGANLVTGNAAGNGATVVSGKKTISARKQRSTLTQHYYPEQGWGWVVIVCASTAQLLVHGLQLSIGQLQLAAAGCSEKEVRLHDSSSFRNSVWLGPCSMAISFLVSPVTVALCRHKSTRITAVIGGLITALGCLFTSFATQISQLVFSYCFVVGIGCSMLRDSSTLMVGQYFKRRREKVEVLVVASGGLGIALMAYLFQITISSLGYRLGMQTVTGLVIITFFLGTFYRSASLYHPQRRAILHLKQQKKKVKDKKTTSIKMEEKQPVFDLTTLKSRTVQIILVTIALTSFGLYTPLFLLRNHVEVTRIHPNKAVLFHASIGLSWAFGCCVAGALLTQNSQECRVSRQYLCQTVLFLGGLAILAFSFVEDLETLVLLYCFYGLCCGAYNYTLKMYLYEKVRARNFANTWGFAQSSQALSLAFGSPLAGYLGQIFSSGAAYYLATAFVLTGSFHFFLVDVHRKRRRRSAQQHTQKHQAQLPPEVCDNRCRERERKSSLPEEDVPLPSGVTLQPAQLLQLLEAAAVARRPHQPPNSSANRAASGVEVCCPLEGSIGAAAIDVENVDVDDIAERLLQELEELYAGDITTCNQVEHCLMFSDFENNLIGQAAAANSISINSNENGESSEGAHGAIARETSNDSAKSSTNRSKFFSEHLALRTSWRKLQKRNQHIAPIEEASL